MLTDDERIKLVTAKLTGTFRVGQCVRLQQEFFEHKAGTVVTVVAVRNAHVIQVDPPLNTSNGVFDSRWFEAV